MIYQIGFSLTTSSREDVFALLEHASGCLAASRPEDRLPNVTANRDGTYTISADIRTEENAVRDELYTRVQQMISSAAPLISGYLNKHDCGHDEGLPCSELVGIVWGEN